MAADRGDTAGQGVERVSGRIAWTKTRWAEEGRAGGFLLFSIVWGTKRQDDMWHLSTTLPLKAAALGQHYPTPTHAKVAAERILAAFVQQISQPTAAPSPDREPGPTPSEES